MADVAAKTEAIAALEMQLEGLRSGLDEKISEISERTTELETLRASVTSLTESREALEKEVERVKLETTGFIQEHQSAIDSAQVEVRLFISSGA